MGEVIQLGNPVEDIDPDNPVTQVLLNSLLCELTDVMVIGWNKDGELFINTNQENRKELLWLIEQVRLDVLDCSEE